MRAKPLKTEALGSVLALAKSCCCEEQHMHQVEKLALQLFDQLAKLHHLGDKEKALLRYGAMLHDIGWSEGQKGHHKAALRMIMEDITIPLNFRDKSIIALVARYHRKRLPAASDKYYCRLNDKDRIIVQKLAGILRIADGLDRTHHNLIESINCELNTAQIVINCSSKEFLDAEFTAADKKADLFNKVFGKKITFCRKPD